MPYWQPANNDNPSVADWVSYVADQVIAQITSGTRPSGTALQVIGETDTGRFQAFDGSNWLQFGGVSSAALNAHTPQLDQGASTNIAKTVGYSQHQRVGNFGLWWGVLTASAGGTAGSVITLTTPWTMATTNLSAGTARIFDSSTTIGYIATIVPLTTSTIRFFVDVTGSTGWGQSPNIALASGDSIHWFVNAPLA